MTVSELVLLRNSAADQCQKQKLEIYLKRYTLWPMTWMVELLDEVVEAELRALPRDMLARL